MQGRNTDTDTENGHVDITGERKGGKNWESGTDMYISTVCKIYSCGQLLQGTRSSAWGSAMPWVGGVVGREAQEGGDTCVHIVDSL